MRASADEVGDVFGVSVLFSASGPEHARCAAMAPAVVPASAAAPAQAHLHVALAEAAKVAHHMWEACPGGKFVMGNNRV